MKRGAKRKSVVIEDGFNTQKLDALKEDELLARREAVLEGKPLEEEDKDFQMLNDMRWIYRMVDGRAKLLSLVKGSDKEFVALVRDMMKIETALMSAKIRAKEETNPNQTVFVVLKGLEGDLELKAGIIDGVNVKQIQHAINPEISEKFEEADPTMGTESLPNEPEGR